MRTAFIAHFGINEIEMLVECRLRNLMRALKIQNRSPRYDRTLNMVGKLHSHPRGQHASIRPTKSEYRSVVKSLFQADYEVGIVHHSVLWRHVLVVWILVRNAFAEVPVFRIHDQSTQVLGKSIRHKARSVVKQLNICLVSSVHEYGPTFLIILAIDELPNLKVLPITGIA